MIPGTNVEGVPTGVSVKQGLLIAGSLLALQACILYAMGLGLLICACGYVKLWHGVVLSSENSQHITDWYTFSHIIHGFLFYGLTWLLLPRACLAWPPDRCDADRRWLGADRKFALDHRALSRLDDPALIITATASSIRFPIRCPHGHRLSVGKLPVALTIALAILFEVLVGLHIRDNLILNIIMLRIRSKLSGTGRGPPIIWQLLSNNPT